MLLRKTFRFEASHVLPKHPGKCSRLHGHSWVLHVETEGPRNEETGFVMDYADMSSAMKPIIEKLDHRHLGSWVVHDYDRGFSNPDVFSGPLAEIHCEDEKNKEYFENWRVPDLPLDFYPTSENLLYWIGEELANIKFKWTKIALEETCTSYAELGLAEFMVYFSNRYGLEKTAVALSEWKKTP